MESSPHSHLPALYQGEEGIWFRCFCSPFIIQDHTNTVTNYFQVSCMLGLVYLTSVAGLIATSAVLHQLSLSRGGQSLLPPPAEISPAQLQTSDLNSEAPSAALRPPCCVLANKSQNRQTGAPGIGQQHAQSPPSASSQTSILCLWGSLLASMGHIHPETNSEMEAPQTWSTASLFCPGCLASLPPLQCGLKNTSTLLNHGLLDNHQRHAPWLPSSLLGGAQPSLNSRLGVFPPVQLGPCHPESMLPVDKAQALLMPG